MGHDTLSNFRAKRALEVAVHVPVRRARVLKERQRPKLGAVLKHFVSRHSSHRLIISIMGDQDNYYGQRENDLRVLRKAYTNAGGTLA
jgi:hypothetical protein